MILEKNFCGLVDRDKLSDYKVLYITTAADGEDDFDKSWMDVEMDSFILLGIKKENIKEYKIGDSNVNVLDYDIMYMMGGNTFYLLDMIRKYNFDKEIKEFINAGKIYVGSSAGSEILGNSIETAIGYDENKVGMTDYTALKIVDGLIVPHCNRKEDYVKKLKETSKEHLIFLYDGDGIIVEG